MMRSWADYVDALQANTNYSLLQRTSAPFARVAANVDRLIPYPNWSQFARDYGAIDGYKAFDRRQAGWMK
jgi:hypothetical protein